MATITVPLTPELTAFIDSQLKLGHAKSKAELVRRALQKMKEDEFIKTILHAKHELASGMGLSGDLDELVKGF